MDDSYNFIFLKKQKVYEDFRKYLIDTYEVDENEANEITEFLTSDFMYSFQIDEKVAEKNFRTNFEKYFVTNDSVVSKFLLPALQKLFEKYPKWYKKGNK